MIREVSFTAADHHEIILWVLNLHEKDLTNVVAFSEDNVEVNKAFANLCEKPLLGCASHRFNSAVEEILKPH